MKILVDDQPYQPSGQPDQTVAELAHEVCNACAESGRRLVVGLRCDGDTIAEEHLEAVLQKPSSEFDRLELQTQPIAALVRATLDTAIELFEDSASARCRAADLLAEGRHEQAMRELQKFCDVWKQVQQTVVASVQALGEDIESLRVNDLRLAELLEPVKTMLGELKESMEQGDLVVVADILRYELDEPLDNWLALLKHLREKAEASSK